MMVMPRTKYISITVDEIIVYGLSRMLICNAIVTSYSARTKRVIVNGDES